MEITIGQRILDANDQITLRNKQLLREHGIFTINIMGSPGAGKTALLEKLIDKLKPEIKMAVIEGDLFTDKDAQRIESQKIPVVQINTKGACHLDGQMIEWALDRLPLNNIELLIIENIGNLVCPAEFDLGEDMRISLLSVTEGEDKVAKYPTMFTGVGAIVLNKVDLLPYTNFKLDDFYKDIKFLDADAKVFEISCSQGSGVDALADWLTHKVKEIKEVK